MSPSGKAPGFGPGISEVRVLPSQPFRPNEKSLGLFFVFILKDENHKAKPCFRFERERAEAGESLRK